MRSRERVIAALEHREPDRVPVDLGGSIMTGMAAKTLHELLAKLPLPPRPVRVYELFQMLGEIDEDLVEHLGCDVLPVEPEAIFFGIRRSGYKPWTLFDGTPVLVPGQFSVETDREGSLLLREEGDRSKPVVAKMPRGGLYFDKVEEQTLHQDFEPPALSEKEKEYRGLISIPRFERMAARAEELRPTGRALFFADWLTFGPPSVGTTPDWLCLLVTHSDYVQRLFALKTETDIRYLEELEKILGGRIDIFGVDGVDFGTQRAELFSPELFERFYLPYYTAINSWIHSRTGWKTWKHTCGSVARFLPHFVQSGLDCINPVQASAAGMDLSRLKSDFGAKLTFWGGGVDTQRTLPFGTPEEVYREVEERIRILAPGGGFVFAAVHNIQAGVPAENVTAMYRAVRDHGKYGKER